MLRMKAGENPYAKKVTKNDDNKSQKYREKVQRFTSHLIGRKIDENITGYS